MAKQAKQQLYFTTRSDIGFAVFEMLFLPVALFFLFLRFEIVYSNTPAPIGDNLPVYWWADMIEHWLIYVLVGMVLVSWAVRRGVKVIEDRKKERAQMAETQQMTKLLEGIRDTLERIESKLGGRYIKWRNPPVNIANQRT